MQKLVITEIQGIKVEKSKIIYGHNFLFLNLIFLNSIDIFKVKRYSYEQNNQLKIFFLVYSMDK